MWGIMCKQGNGHIYLQFVAALLRHLLTARIQGKTRMIREKGRLMLTMLTQSQFLVPEKCKLRCRCTEILRKQSDRKQNDALISRQNSIIIMLFLLIWWHISDLNNTTIDKIGNSLSCAHCHVISPCLAALPIPIPLNLPWGVSGESNLEDRAGDWHPSKSCSCGWWGSDALTEYLRLQMASESTHRWQMLV
jgi:hypothetical protein